MVQETKRPSVLKFVLIVIGAALALCLMCVTAFMVDTATSLVSFITAPTRTPFPVTSRFVTQIMSIQQDKNRPVRLNFPRYVDTDQDGNIYVGNAGDGNIVIFDATGNFLRSIPVLEKGSTMYGLATTPQGTIYLAADGDVRRIDAQGDDTILSIDSPFAGNVNGIIMDKDGSLLATDEAGDILRLNTDGTVKMLAATPFDTHLNESEDWIGIAVDESGNIYALGGHTCIVLKFDSEGTYLSQLGGRNRNHVVQDINDPPGAFPAMDPGYFYDPMAIAVDKYGRILVSDSTYNVQVFDINGQYIDSFETPGITRWVIFDRANNLYAASDLPEVIKLTVHNP